MGTGARFSGGPVAPIHSCMRIAGVLACAFLVALGSGCFVVDEIDQGMKIWKHHSPKKKSPPAAEEPAPTASEPSAKPDAWWRGARSLGSEGLSADIVSCSLEGATQFMREADCLSQGGTPR